MSCQISNVQASAVYTATDVLLHHYRKCITKYVAAKKQNCCFANFILPMLIGMQLVL